MAKVDDYLYITVSKDQMLAEIHCTDSYNELNRKIDASEIHQLLKEHRVMYGVDDKIVQSLAKKLDTEYFPFVIAKGKLPEHGKDGEVTFEFDSNTQIDQTTKLDFREVMRIPFVEKGQRLATMTIPTGGKNGKNVGGGVVQARPGREANIRAGKNVVFREETNMFFAADDGQVSMRGRYLDVVSVYEVNESLSMATGNLDFIGSITIHGDVPTGFTVKAGRDIRIFGLVEAASIHAGGSVFISEGLAGLEIGKIEAEEDIHLGYINQGIVHAGESIYVENSILHSECIANDDIICRLGNIIGGSSSAGRKIEAKDVGNRLNTKTTIHLGENNAIAEETEKLTKKQKILKSRLAKLAAIGKKLEANLTAQDVKTRVTLLRQRKSYEQTEKQLAEINEKLTKENAYLGSEKEAVLIVRNSLFPNTIVAFGKYRSKIKKITQYTKLQLENNEISIQTLK